uniref:G-protein coupled receptors family 1 profile domain-containing protein n=1 Tax=Denticeps clupeoides TaxID=299321 RepID=A0AAY3ZV33_9TELE
GPPREGVAQSPPVPARARNSELSPKGPTRLAMEVFKEDRCPFSAQDECAMSNASDARGGAQEPMSPIIPVITAVYSMVFVVGLMGNCLVMYVIVRYTKMKTATNIYIFNLALADALVTTTMPFQSADYLLNSWPFGEVVCKVFISIDYYNMFTSILTLTMMSVDRYVAVCHPVKALDFRTPLKAKVINVGIWVLSSAAGVPAMVLGGTQTNNGTTECALQFPDPYEYWDTLMKLCVFVLAFVVPVLIITVCYSLMVLRLRSVRLLSGSREKDRNLRRITRLVLVVVLVFVVCWTPIHIFILVKALVGVPETTPVMAAYFFCVALGYTNSSLNPVLYAFLDENFKRCFKDFCFPTARGGRGRGSHEARGSGREGGTVRRTPCPAESPPRTAKPA